MATALRVYRAVVISTADPEGLGRVKLGVTRTVRGVPVPSEGWATAGATALGATVVAVTGLSEGDAVLYAAEKLPFAGAVVLCRTGPPSAPASGSSLTLRVALGEGHEATIEAAFGALRVRTTAGQEVTLQANGAIDVVGQTALSVAAPQLTVSADLLTLDAGMSKFSGVLKCDTLIANTVIASTYTPGAGNLV